MVITEYNLITIADRVMIVIIGRDWSIFSWDTYMEVKVAWFSLFACQSTPSCCQIPDTNSLQVPPSLIFSCDFYRLRSFSKSTYYYCTCMCSDNDLLLPSRHEGERLHHLLTKSEIRTFDDSGHMLFMVGYMLS